MRFPLILSCGHGAIESCRCAPVRAPKVYDSGPSPVDEAHAANLGIWRQTIESYGFRLPSGGKHGPWPVCGGTDRFRFSDKNGRGTWFCSQCDVSSGGGLLLLSRCLGLSVMDTAKKLTGEDIRATPRPPIKIANTDESRARDEASAKLGAAKMLSIATLREHEYMNKKGLFGEWLTNGEPMSNAGEITPIGARLLVPAYKNGELVNVQKIRADGTKMFITGGIIKGAFNKINGSSMIGVCEGFATAVTINRLTNATVYCAFQAGNLAEVAKTAQAENPNERIIIFADSDEQNKKTGRCAGGYFAEQAAVPIGAAIAMPPELGDWDDYRQRYGDALAAAAIYAAIEQDLVTEHAPPPPPPPPSTSKPLGIDLACTPEPPPAPAPAQKSTARLPPSISLDGYDIDTPPDLAGEIVEYIRAGANRVLGGGAYAGMALQCMAMAGAGLQGFKSVKLSLITITLGVSASGKEHPQRVIKSILEPHNKTIYGDIRSDKDIIRSAIYDNGHCFYLVDEAQKIFPSATQNKHMNNVISTLMELSTTGCYKLSQLHRDEFLADIETRKARAEKTLAAKKEAAEAFNPLLDAAAIKKNELDIKFYSDKIAAFDERAETAKNGVKNPALHLVAYSTPQKLAAIVDEDGIESGLLGRGLIFDCGAERGESVIDFDKEDTHYKIDPRLEHLRAQVGLICQLADDVKNGSGFCGDFRFEPTPDALADLRAISAHYDQYHFRNHVRAGAIYARLIERVLSLCSIMALGNIVQSKAIIKREYVRYALMIVLSSLDHLMSNLKINEGATDSSIEARIDALREAIAKRLTVPKNDPDDGWRYKSKIRDYMKRRKFFVSIQEDCKKENQDAFENALAALGGRLEVSENGAAIRLRP